MAKIEALIVNLTILCKPLNNKIVVTIAVHFNMIIICALYLPVEGLMLEH